MGVQAKWRSTSLTSTGIGLFESNVAEAVVRPFAIVSGTENTTEHTFITTVVNTTENLDVSLISKPGLGLDVNVSSSMVIDATEHLSAWRISAQSNITIKN